MKLLNVFYEGFFNKKTLMFINMLCIILYMLCFYIPWWVALATGSHLGIKIGNYLFGIWGKKMIIYFYGILGNLFGVHACIYSLIGCFLSRSISWAYDAGVLTSYSCWKGDSVYLIVI